MSARAWLHDIRRRRWWQWTEIAIVVSIAVLSGLLVRPDDPFFVRSPFQWLWIAPALLALRYGTTGGIASMVLLLLAWHALRGQVPRGYEIFPKEFFLGGGILALVCGEFSDVWRGRLRRERKLNGYMDDRLEQLTRAHYMLRLSHERLEQSLVSRPATLRDGMARLRDLVARSQDPLSPQAIQEFLQLVNQYCPMEVASIHPTDGRTVSPETIANLGNPAPPAAGDGLIDFCLREGELAHVPIDGVGAVESRYLVAAPWRTRSGQWLGILLVEEMAFFAFHRENLQWLAVLLAYYADHIETIRDGRPMRAVLDDCPVEFAQEIVKLARIQQETGVRTSLVALTPGNRPDQAELLHAIQRTQRGLDLAWYMEGDADPVLLVLMPLSDAAAVEGYIARVEGILRDRFRLSAAEAFLHHASCTLDDADPAVTVSDLVSRLRVSYHAAAAA